MASRILALASGLLLALAGLCDGARAQVPPVGDLVVWCNRCGTCHPEGFSHGGGGGGGGGWGYAPAPGEPPPPPGAAELERAERRLAAKDHEGAIDAYLASLRQRSGNKVAWNNLGVCYSKLGSWAAAREAFERALALEPGYAHARENLEALDRYLRQVEESRRILEAHRIRGARWNEGMDALRAKDYMKAAAAFRAYVELEPGDPAGWFNVAACLDLASDLLGALDVLAEIARRFPGNADLRARVEAFCTNNAALLNLRADPRDPRRCDPAALALAEEVLRRGLALGADPERLRPLLLASLRRQVQTAEACRDPAAREAAARRWTEADPSSAEARRQWGEGLLGTGRVEEGKAALWQAAALARSEPGVGTAVGTRLRELGDLDGAIRAYGAAIDAARDGEPIELASALVFRAAALGAAGRGAAARLDLLAAADFAPGDVTVQSLAGVLLHEAGHRDDALAPLERVLEQATSVERVSPKIRGYLAELYVERAEAALRRGEAGEALRLRDRAAKASPDAAALAARWPDLAVSTGQAAAARDRLEATRRSVRGLESLPPGSVSRDRAGVPEGLPGPPAAAPSSTYHAAESAAEHGGYAVGSLDDQDAWKHAGLVFETSAAGGSTADPPAAFARRPRRDVEVPPEHAGGPVGELAAKRDGARRAAAALERRLAELEGRAERTPEDQVAIARARQQLSAARSAAYAYNLLAEEELREATRGLGGR